MLSCTVEPVVQLFLVTSTVQLAIEVDSPKEVPKAVDYFKNTVLACRMHSDKDKVIFDPNMKIRTLKIPNTISTIQESAEYVANHPFQLEDRYGQIGSNDRFVVIDLAHALGDGLFFRYLVDHYGHNPYPPLNRFPYFFTDSIENQISSAPIYYPTATDPTLTRFYSRASKEEIRNNK